MVKKLLEAKSDASCKKGCKGQILPSGKYCPCIEIFLPKLGSHRSIKALSLPDLNRFPSQEEKITAEESEFDLRRLLKKYDLLPTEISIVLAKCFSQLTFKEIAKRFRLKSKGSAQYWYKRALRKLKEKGFKIP